jgi:hypothetical protein
MKEKGKQDSRKNQTFAPRFAEKKINVFVSSTFRDMIAERDEMTLPGLPRNSRRSAKSVGLPEGKVDPR